jgi:hypothetical protein
MVTFLKMLMILFLTSGLIFTHLHVKLVILLTLYNLYTVNPCAMQNVQTSAHEVNETSPSALVLICIGVVPS